MSTNNHYISTGGQQASSEEDFVPDDYEFLETLIDPEIFWSLSRDGELPQLDESERLLYTYDYASAPINNHIYKRNPEATSEEFVPNDEEFIVCYLKTHETMEFYD